MDRCKEIDNTYTEKQQSESIRKEQAETNIMFYKEMFDQIVKLT